MSSIRARCRGGIYLGVVGVLKERAMYWQSYVTLH